MEDTQTVIEPVEVNEVPSEGGAPDQAPKPEGGEPTGAAPKKWSDSGKVDRNKILEIRKPATVEKVPADAAPAEESEEDSANPGEPAEGGEDSKTPENGDVPEEGEQPDGADDQGTDESDTIERDLGGRFGKQQIPAALNEYLDERHRLEGQQAEELGSARTRIGELEQRVMQWENWYQQSQGQTAEQTRTHETASGNGLESKRAEIQRQLDEAREYEDWEAYGNLTRQMASIEAEAGLDHRLKAALDPISKRLEQIGNRFAEDERERLVSEVAPKFYGGIVNVAAKAEGVQVAEDRIPEVVNAIKTDTIFKGNLRRHLETYGQPQNEAQMEDLNARLVEWAKPVVRAVAARGQAPAQNPNPNQPRDPQSGKYVPKAKVPAPGVRGAGVPASIPSNPQSSQRVRSARQVADRNRI